MEERISVHRHAGGDPTSHRRYGFVPKYLRRSACFLTAERISINRDDSLNPAAVDPVAMEHSQRTSLNTVDFAFVAGEWPDTLLKARKRLDGFDWYGETQTHHISGGDGLRQVGEKLATRQQPTK